MSPERRLPSAGPPAGLHEGERRPLLKSRRTDDMRMAGRRAHAAAMAAVAVFAFLVYARGLGNGFVYDDTAVVLENPLIRDISNLPLILLGDAWGFTSEVRSSYYRPVLHIALGSVYHFFGLNPLGYNLMSVTTHAMNSVLVYLAAAAVFGAAGRRGVRAPLMAAVLFSVHPVTTEPVYWISSFSDLSYTLFTLAAFLLYARAGSRPSATALSVACFSIALLSKETALVLAPLVVLWDYTLGDRPPDMKAAFRRYLPYMLAVAAYLALRVYVLEGMVPHKKVSGLTAYEYFINVFPLIEGYMNKLLLPVNLNAFYTFDPLRSLLEGPRSLSLLAFPAYLAALYVSWRRSRAAFFLLVWMALPLLQTLYIPAVGANVLAERYLYLPAAGFAMLLVLGLERLRNDGRSGRLATGAFLLITVLFSAVTIDRRSAWKDDFSLWSDAVKKSPGAFVPHNNLGVEYYRKGMRAEARREFETAAALKPDYPDARNNLGAVYSDMGLHREAVEQFRMAVALKPDYFDAVHNLGLAYMDRGRYAEAIRAFQQALSIRPGHVNSYVRLGDAFSSNGQYREAVESLRQALSLDPNHMDARLALGVTYLKVGATQYAVREFEEALRLDPGNVTAQRYLRMALGIKQRP